MRLTRILLASRRMPENYHNFPERYIRRTNMFLIRRAPDLPQFEQKIFRYKNQPYYDQWRPWEFEAQKLNQYGINTRRIFVEPIKDWQFFRGDRVEVTRGPDKGKQGIINYIVKERNWVFVHGLNIKRELRGASKISSGLIASLEQPLLINLEVKLVDPSDLLPTEIEWRYDDEGNRLRVSTRTERVIPIPDSAYETIDYVSKEVYKETDKDTPAKVVNEITFTPTAKTFEMDICDEHGIKDDRIPYPMYWY